MFKDYSFTEHNPVSIAIGKVLQVLDGNALEAETESLEGFYESVRDRISGIDTAQGRQKIVLELYEKFFSGAFARTVERLGIVYTPVEVVDFILHSVNDALRQEFGLGLSDQGVHILDPITGTGTFIVALRV